jgi:ankyrin repeat protein
MKPDTSRNYLLIFSAILIGYQYFGLVTDGAIPYTQIKIPSQTNVLVILTVLIIFFGSQYIYGWLEEKKEDRSVFWLITSLPLAIIAVAPVFYGFLKKIGIDWKVISSSIFILLIGCFLAIAIELIISILFSLRTTEEMKKLGLGKVPSASKAFIQSLFLLIPINALILFSFVKFSYILPTPLANYWLAMFLTPTLFLNFDNFINILKCVGPPKVRKKALERLRVGRRAMDLHEMLYQYMGIEERKDYEKPAIVEFARDNNLVEVQKLLDSGIYPNTQDRRGWSPLMWATVKKNLAVVKLLLEYGADPNLVNYLGRSAIMYASKYGSYEIAKALIENGAILNPTIKLNNRPPLSEAASRGYLEVVRLLVEHGANVMYKGKDNKSALDLAMDEGFGDVAKYLRKIMLEMDKTPAEDKTNLVKNIDWIGNNDDKERDISHSKHISSLEEIHKIRDYKRLLNSKSDEELAEELGIPINAPPQAMQKAMQEKYSMRSGCTIKLLGVDQQGETVGLQIIPKNPKEKSWEIGIPKKLVDKYMEEYFSAHLDRTPSDRNLSQDFINAAIAYACNQVLKSSEVHEVSNALLQEYVEAGNEEHVKELLLNQDIDVNERGEDGWTALLYASAQGYPRILRSLLEKGAKPDIGNFLGMTPLMYGARYGNLEVCNIMLEYGANIDAQDDQGWTALTIATRFGLINVVERLLAAGANKAIKDRNRMTALDHAKKCKQGEIAKLLRTAKESGTLRGTLFTY